MLGDFYIQVTHAQIVVFLTSTGKKSLIWEDEHVAQGFVWSPGDVGFGVPDHDGVCRIQVDQARKIQIDPASLWAIQVPFKIDTGRMMIGSVMEQQNIKIDKGNYNLIFEALSGRKDDRNDCAYIIKFTFCSDESPNFSILKSGIELTTNKVLRRDSQTQ